ncbi:DoxX family membrane protein [Corynebacterium coyleae]|uniref:DoxX family protein n=1 Tax=Corynebacterium coyleae TaxID=53374 RepID=UPI00254F2131|nr:DoxX family membrane protein [Corynebacterium coyleae]MDK8822727.1 DoxX family membrane protein [Corynebacterium coyleae]
MAKNPRDLTPDDLNNLENVADVPEYKGDAATEIFPQTSQTGDEVRLSADKAAQASAPSAGSTAVPSASAYSSDPAPVTSAFIRESETIAPAAPATYAEEPVEPVAVDPAPAVVEEEDARRGTTDFGLLLLRLFLGAYLIIDSVAVFFRLGGNDGIAGLENAFADYPYGNGLAVVVPTLELTAGVFLVLGLLGPIAAAVATAVTGFLALHAFNGQTDGFNVFAWTPETWVPVMLLAVSLAVQFTGPGRYGIDASRGWAKRPLASSWICAIVGLAAAGAAWWFGTGINPFA